MLLQNKELMITKVAQMKSEILQIMEEGPRLYNTKKTLEEELKMLQQKNRELEEDLKQIDERTKE